MTLHCANSSLEHSTMFFCGGEFQMRVCENGKRNKKYLPQPYRHLNRWTEKVFQRVLPHGCYGGTCTSSNMHSPLGRLCNHMPLIHHVLVHNIHISLFSFNWKHRPIVLIKLFSEGRDFRYPSSPLTYWAEPMVEAGVVEATTKYHLLQTYWQCWTSMYVFGLK